MRLPFRFTCILITKYFLSLSVHLFATPSSWSRNISSLSGFICSTHMHPYHTFPLCAFTFSPSLHPHHNISSLFVYLFDSPASSQHFLSGSTFLSQLHPEHTAFPLSFSTCSTHLHPHHTTFPLSLEFTFLSHLHHGHTFPLVHLPISFTCILIPQRFFSSLCVYLFASSSSLTQHFLLSVRPPFLLTCFLITHNITLVSADLLFVCLYCLWRVSTPWSSYPHEVTHLGCSLRLVDVDLATCCFYTFQISPLFIFLFVLSTVKHERR